MELIEAIKGRRSIRQFLDKPVSHQVMEEIVDIAAFAPSWKNTQTTRYIAIEDKAITDKIADECVLGFSYNTKTIKNAAALIVVTVVNGRSGYEKDGTPTTSKEDRWENFDAGIASQTFCLAAHEKGLGTVIMGIFDEGKVADIVGIPEGQQIAAFIAIGYPVSTPEAPKRKTSSELLTFK